MKDDYPHITFADPEREIESVRESEVWIAAAGLCSLGFVLGLIVGLSL